MNPQDRNDHAGNGEERVVVRDRRRIDPETGEVRSPAGAESSDPGQSGAADGPESAPDPVADTAAAELAAQVAERTADLQRLSAEYANYRRRMDRDRESTAVTARAQVVSELLTVLDDIDRAAAHGDLTGPFKSVADKLVAVVQKQGLEAFGVEGDEFDPSLHEAVQHEQGDDTEGPTVTVVSTVMRRGYRVGDRMLRPAMVAVADRVAEAVDDDEPEQ